MALPSSTAQSISQVSGESVRVGLQGSVQTVFPVHACMPPTANNETQDYGTVGSDGPIEGATKVFQVTLRDLSASSGGGTHRTINAYFYDNWADDYSGVSMGNELAITGPASSLVYPDPSADAGDHPFCLVFYSEGGGSGAGGRAGNSRVACRVVTPSGRVGRGEPAARRGRGQAQGGAGSGQERGGGSRGGKYTYTSLANLRPPVAKAYIYGVVSAFSHRRQSKGRDATISVSLLDETCTQADNAVPCNFFDYSKTKLPGPIMVGDIVRVHRAKVQEYKGRPQLVGGHTVAWLVIRKKKNKREAFQRGLPIGSGGGGGGGGGSGSDGGGGGGDDEADPFGDSPPSGPDAGGGEVDSVLSSAVWEVDSSSTRYTMSQVDQDRCNALDAWFRRRAAHLWLKQSSEPKNCIKDIFLRPPPGQEHADKEVDLICCLVSKHESPPGGSGSLSHVFVTDCSGFAHMRPPNEPDEGREAALRKGMRAALGRQDWSPGNPCPTPVPAYLKVDVVVNKKEWESLALSPGMWVRLKRLTISKNTHSGHMLARMKEGTSSVNPLHPAMAEVQTIAIAYARACTAANAASAPPPPAVNTSAQRESRRVSDDEPGPAPSPAPGPASGPIPTPTPTRKSGSDTGGRGSGGAQDSGLDGGGGSAPPERGRRGASPRSQVEEGASALRCEQPTQSPGSRPRSQPERREAGGGAGSGGAAAAIDAASGVVSGGPGGSGGSGSEDVSRRGTKRALPAGGAEGREEVPESAGCGPLSDLGTVRRKVAPGAFDTRVKIVAHFPSKVEDFVRQGPEPGDGPRFLFMLRLEDDHGVVDAIATGLDASHLLPGTPSPEQFRTRRDVRERVEGALARLESPGGGVWGVRLRSYLTPMASNGSARESDSRPSFCCKRYSIIVPSSLQEGNARGEG